MDLWTVALACMVSALACGAVVRWMAVQTRPAHAQRTVTPAPPVGDRALIERLEALERSFPAWRIEMENLAEQCAEVLDTAERKRKRAAANMSRAERENVEEQPSLVEDPRERRLAELRLVRQRLGR